MFSADLGHGLFYLLLGECLLARATLIPLFDYFVIDQIIREVDAMKPEAEIVNEVEIFIRAGITNKKL